MKMYSENIEVECEGTILRPVAFRWRGAVFTVQRILRDWQDWRFPEGAPRKKNWRMRRHRNVFVVQTNEGRVFELYFDRKAPDPVWVLFRELDA